MVVNSIPEKVVNFNIYDEDERLLGVSGEITLPKFENMSETISGAGIAGEYEAPTPGHFKSMSIDIPFRVLYEQTFNLLQNGTKTLFLRASQQFNDIAAGSLDFRALKITLRGNGKGIDLGKVSVGKPTESSNTMEVLYIKIEENNFTLVEYDKVNFIFVVNGVDQLALVRSQI